MLAALGQEGDELLSIESDRKASRCTARCLDARADLRAAVLGAVAEGQGSRRVAAAFGVSREVVRALRRQALESGELDRHKQSIGLDALALAREAIDRCRDEIDEMPRASLPILAGVYSDKDFMCDFDGKYTGMLDLKWAANLYDITAKIELARGMKTRYGSHFDNARNADKCRARALPDTAICTCCGDHVSTHFDEHCVTKEEMHVFDRHKHVECRTYCGLLSCTQAWRLFAPEK